MLFILKAVNKNTQYDKKLLQLMFRVSVIFAKNNCVVPHRNEFSFQLSPGLYTLDFSYQKPHSFENM